MCLFRHVWQLQPADVAASARPVLHEHALPEGGHQPIRQPTGADVGHAAAALPRFHARHHDIELDVRDFQQVTEGQMSGVDLMLVLGWPKAPDLVCRRIAAGRFIVVASPAYWAAHGMPERPMDLERHVCLTIRAVYGAVMDAWRFSRGAEQETVRARGWITTSSAHRELAAARRPPESIRWQAAASQSPAPS